MHTIYAKTIFSPVGPLRLTATDRGLCGVAFSKGKSAEDDTDHPVLGLAEAQLAEYFSGTRKSFDLPLAPNGTVFQQKAWRELQNIPYGQTISYGEQARRIGDANKARAIGMANNRNPICIIIPCHRVIGASGALVGFGGGLKAKQHLLDLERKVSGQGQRAA